MTLREGRRIHQAKLSYKILVATVETALDHWFLNSMLLDLCEHSAKSIDLIATQETSYNEFF